MSTASRPAVIPTGYGETGSQLAPTNAQLTAGAAALQEIGFGLWNWLQFFESNGVRYLSRTGIATWSSAETYIAGDIVRGTHGSLFIARGSTTNVDPEGFDSGANWLPYSSGGLLGYYLDPLAGAHADIHVTTSLTVSGDYNAKNITIDPGAVMTIQNGILRVQGTLNIAAGGILECDQPTNLAGGNQTTGAQGVGGNNSANGTIFGGSNGGAGSLTGGASAGDTIQDAIGSAGGAGGTGGSGVGGAGGAVTAFNAATCTSVLQCVRNGGFGSKRGGVASARVPSVFGLQGGSGGGGGGGDGTNHGGGGGAGGGLLIVICNHLNLGGDGTLRAPGGAGGNTLGTAGPGGGGGGGSIVVLYRSITGTTPTAANCVPGGAAGTGGAANGTAGNMGTLNLYQI